MLLHKLRTDFNSNSLENPATQMDLQRQGIVLQEGMRFIFYDLDRQDNQDGYLHTIGSVWYDAHHGVFRIDLRTVNWRFTPGTDTAALDCMYADADTASGMKRVEGP